MRPENNSEGPARLAPEEVAPATHAMTRPVSRKEPARDRARENAEERALLERFRVSGDEAAFDELVRRTEARVRAVALSVLSDPASAEDAAQETFLRAFRRAADFRGEGPVAAWLCRIAVRVAHDALRRAARRERLARRLGVVSPDPDDRLRERADLARAMRSLAAEESEPLLLKVVVGMTYREIAEAAGVPAGTIQTRVHRARKKLLALVTAP